MWHIRVLRTFRNLRVSRYLFLLLVLLLCINAAVYVRDRRRSLARVPAIPSTRPAASAALLDKGPAVILAGDTTPGIRARPVSLMPADVAGPKPPTVTPLSSIDKILGDVHAKQDAGDLVAARTLLNEPFVSGRLSPVDAQAARQALMDINQKLIFSAKTFPDDPFEASVMIQQGMRLQKLANQFNITWPLLCRVNGYEPTDAGAKRIRAGRPIKAIKGPFSAVVTKSAFRMDLYLGGLPGEAGCTYVTSIPVGLGKDDSTPTGLWTIELHNKVRNPVYYSPRGEGVFKSDDPRNPLGGYWIGLKGEQGNAIGKNSYGIHGTIEPDSIGKQSSMGCIRLGHDDIALVFDLLVETQSRVMVQ